MRVTVTPEQIRSAFEAVKDDPSFDESRGLWERGQPPVEMLQAMCLRPEILRAFGGFGDGVYPGGLLERRVKELVIITASHANECQFCTNSHCDIVDIADILDEPLTLIAQPGGAARRASASRSSTRGPRWPTRTHIPRAAVGRAARGLHRPGAGRADVPHRLHQHAQPVQQLPRRPLQRRLPRAGSGAGGRPERRPGGVEAVAQREHRAVARGLAGPRRVVGRLAARCRASSP